MIPPNPHLPFSRESVQQNSWGQVIVAFVEWWGVGVVNLTKKDAQHVLFKCVA